MSNAAHAAEQPGSLQDSENVHPDKLLTDRSTYIGYLESQLERVTNACLTVQSFDQRLETVTSAARLLEEKVRSLVQHCAGKLFMQQMQLPAVLQVVYFARCLSSDELYTALLVLSLHVSFADTCVMKSSHTQKREEDAAA